MLGIDGSSTGLPPTVPITRRTLGPISLSLVRPEALSEMAAAHGLSTVLAQSRGGRHRGARRTRRIRSRMPSSGNLRPPANFGDTETEKLRIGDNLANSSRWWSCLRGSRRQTRTSWRAWFARAAGGARFF